MGSALAFGARVRSFRSAVAAASTLGLFGLCHCNGVLGDLDAAHLVEADAGRVDVGPSNAPGPPSGPETLPAPRRLLLVGGINVATSLPDAWSWDGARWTEERAVLPIGLDGMGLAPLGESLVFMGGESVTPDGGYAWDGMLTWDGLGWWRWNPSPSPTPRSGVAMTTLGDRVVLFGGYGRGASSSAPLGDTWTWDGAAWVEQHPPTSPSARAWATFAALGEKLVLYGGRDALGHSLDETWTWDGETWERVATAGPPPRSEAAMANAKDELVLFGGEEASANKIFGDTWTWDGHTWTQRNVTAPPPRYSAAIGTLNGDAVLFGGYGVDTSDAMPDRGDTWTWDGAQWTEQKVPGPLARHGAAMATDSSRRGGT